MICTTHSNPSSLGPVSVQITGGVLIAGVDFVCYTGGFTIQETSNLTTKYTPSVRYTGGLHYAGDSLNQTGLWRVDSGWWYTPPYPTPGVKQGIGPWWGRGGSVSRDAPGVRVRGGGASDHVIGGRWWFSRVGGRPRVP